MALARITKKRIEFLLKRGKQANRKNSLRFWSNPDAAINSAKANADDGAQISSNGDASPLNIYSEQIRAFCRRAATLKVKQFVIFFRRGLMLACVSAFSAVSFSIRRRCIALQLLLHERPRRGHRRAARHCRHRASVRTSSRGAALIAGTFAGATI